MTLVVSGRAYAGTIEEGWPSGTANTCRNATDGFMDFERGVDGVQIESSIPGLQFTTTSGLNWQYADVRTGQYNVRPLGTQAYEANTNFFAWLGTTGDIGRITFVGGGASYMSVLVSTNSGLYLEAYDSGGNLLDSSGFAPPNTGTGTLTRMTVEAPNIAYVEIHDTGNFWLMDDLCSDAPSPCQRVAGYGSGNPSERIDLVFVPATDYAGDNATFLADVNTHIGRLLAHPPLDAAADKFNFYFTDREGTAAGFGAGGACATLPEDLLTQCPFLDAAAVLHVGSFTDCTNYSGGTGIFGGEGHDATLRSFIHEGGHAMFRVADEYDDASRMCATSYDVGVASNIWQSDADCEAAATANGGDPNQCYQFTACQGGWFKLGDPSLATDADRYADGNFRYIMFDGTEFAKGWGDASTWRMDTVLSGLGARAELPLPEPSREQSLVISIVVDSSGISLVDTGFLVSPAPNYRNEPLPYQARLLASDGSLLGVFPFDDPRALFGEPGPEAKPTILSAPATLVLPYYFNIDRAELVETATQDVLLDIDLSNLANGLAGPSADAGGPYSGQEGDTLHLDASGSFATHGTLVRYEWDVNGDGTVDVNTTSATADYQAGDNFDGLVHVRVTDSDGLTAVASTGIHLTNIPPTIEAGCDVFAYDDGVPFSVQITDPGSLDTHTIVWQFGDGTTLETTSTSVVHAYRTPGFYDVTVTVTDDDGGGASDGLMAEVKNANSDRDHRRQTKRYTCTPKNNGHGHGGQP